MELKERKPWGATKLEPDDLDMRIVNPWDPEEIEDEPNDYTTSEGVLE